MALCCVLFSLVAGLGLAAGAAPEKGLLRQFSALEVLEIENERNERGERLPPESLPALHKDLVYAMVNLHLFRRVQDYTDPKVAEPKHERVVQMRVRVIGYSGAQNNARVTVMVHFISKESRQEVLQEKVNARLQYDQGALSGALRKLVRSTADVVRDRW